MGGEPFKSLGDSDNILSTKKLVGTCRTVFLSILSIAEISLCKQMANFKDVYELPFISHR